MNVGEFITYLSENGCDIVPMPEWNKANTLQIINRFKPYGNRANLNTNIKGDLFDSTIELICTRLGVPLPPNYSALSD